MAAEALSRQEIDDRLRELPHWRFDPEQDLITRTYRFPEHLRAAAMVLQVARVQDELDHHADLRLGYDTLTVAVHTHSAGGRVTERDLSLAHRIEALAPEAGAD